MEKAKKPLLLLAATGVVLILIGIAVFQIISASSKKTSNELQAASNVTNVPAQTSQPAVITPTSDPTDPTNQDSAEMNAALDSLNASESAGNLIDDSLSLQQSDFSLN